MKLINHGISSSLVEKIKTDIQDFFNLPMEEKKKLWQHSGEVEGFGQAFVKSEEQKLDWNDIFFLTTLPVSLRKPHLFPKLPTPFRFFPFLWVLMCFCSQQILTPTYCSTYILISCMSNLGLLTIYITSIYWIYQNLMLLWLHFLFFFLRGYDCFSEFITLILTG